MTWQEGDKFAHRNFLSDRVNSIEEVRSDPDNPERYDKFFIVRIWRSGAVSYRAWPDRKRGGHTFTATAEKFNEIAIPWPKRKKPQL